MGMAIVAVAAVLILVMIRALTGPMLEAVSNPALVRATIHEKGIVGVLGFMGMIVLQVIAAAIPGGPFEVAAGYAFGLIQGTLICSAAMTFGSLIVFLLSRKFGTKVIELFFSPEKIASMKFLQTSEKTRRITFLLFLIPGTPKDLLSYVVGLTDMRTRDWLWIVAIARFPSIFLSVMSGSALGGGSKLLCIGILAGVGALSAVGGLLYRRHQAKHRAKSKAVAVIEAE